MFESLKEKIFSKYLGSIVRTALAALGGYLISRYGLDEDLIAKFVENTTQVLTVLAPLIVAQLWSWIQKWRSTDKPK